MRVAVVTESFLPAVNGVTGSVLRVCDHLVDRGHEVLVVAPGPGPTSYGPTPVLRAPWVPTPGYRGFRLGRPWPALPAVLRRFEPDLVHLASPAVLGAQGAFVAQRLGIPAVAVFQTDLGGFARRYGVGPAEAAAWRWIRRVHGAATLTLAPSRAAVDALRLHGVPRVELWRRGVDLHRFSPVHRDDALRRALAPDGQALVGFVGRLAAEKQLELLRLVDRDPRLQLVVVGEGPQRRRLQRALPHASFVGLQSGEELARSFASFDVFVHAGAHETFCQSAQEALASGVPVVAAAAGGLLDLVVPGTNGLLVPPHDATSLHAAVLRLTTDAALRQQLSAGARASVAHRGWARYGDELLEHYARATHDRLAARLPLQRGELAA